MAVDGRVWLTAGQEDLGQRLQIGWAIQPAACPVGTAAAGLSAGRSAGWQHQDGAAEKICTPKC